MDQQKVIQKIGRVKRPRKYQRCFNCGRFIKLEEANIIYIPESDLANERFEFSHKYNCLN